MNRSFVFGIIVASTTWCFSLYLYWSLTRSASDVPLKSMQLGPVPDSQHYVALKHSNYHNDLNQLIDKEAKYQEQKDNLYKKYKKEKKFRKISQKLMDELKPIQEQGGNGNAFLLFAKESSIFELD